MHDKSIKRFKPSLPLFELTRHLSGIFDISKESLQSNQEKWNNLSEANGFIERVRQSPIKLKSTFCSSSLSIRSDSS